MQRIKMNCPNCGHSISLDLNHPQVYCPYCSQKLTEETDQPQESSTDKKISSRKQEEKSGITLMLGLIFGILFCILVVMFFAWIQPQIKEKREAEERNKKLSELFSITIQGWDQETEPIRTVQMKVFVLMEDSAQALEEIVGDPIGIMGQVDREESEKVLTRISSELNVSMKVRTYNSLIEELLALYRGEVRSVILDQEFMDVIAGIPGYEDVKERIRLLE